MTGSPLVSVIVPNYNHARFLDQRLQSILNQTYRNIEVIILDDCSTDNSLEVIEKYRSDARIVDVIVNEKNSGNTFLQWNKGIHLAKGELVWIAESDDYCELNMLEELVNAYHHRLDTVLAFSTLIYVDESGQILSRPKLSSNKHLSGSTFLRRYLALTNVISNASCVLFSRDAALRASSKYMTYNGAGDYLLWVLIASRGNVAIVNKGLSYFRRHTGVVTERRYYDGTNFREEKKIYDILKQLVWISAIRQKLVYAYHGRRLDSCSYLTDDIKKEVRTIWNADNNDSMSWGLLHLSDFFRERYNYYI